MRYFLLISCVFLLVSCKEEPIPKPEGFLRLSYDSPKYKEINLPLPFTFERNVYADSISELKISRNGKVKGIDIVYPNMKGTIYITYKKISDGDLEPYLIDAQNITQKHTMKADEIVEQPYIDDDKNVYGMFYEVGGNAASQSQFYVTDSLRHFITGSLYFYTKPNYDSILPAAYYLRNDIKHIMETIRWK